MVKKILKISFLIMFFLLFNTPVFAAECTDKDIETLKELAKKIEFSYEFQKSEGNEHSFDIKAYNLSNKFYLRMPNGLDFVTDKAQGYLGDFLDGEKIDVEIYASGKTICADEFLISKTIQLPTYNVYSSREECKNNKDLDVCKEWSDTENLSEEQFLKIINSLNQIEDNDEDDFSRFIKQYAKYIVIVGVAIIGGISIYIVIRNKRKIKIDI